MGQVFTKFFAQGFKMDFQTLSILMNMLENVDKVDKYMILMGIKWQPRKSFLFGRQKSIYHLHLSNVHIDHHILKSNEQKISKPCDLW